MTTRSIAAAALLVSVPLPMRAGTRFGVVDCNNTGPAGNFCVQGTDSNGDPVSPSATVHPPGYDGTQATLTVTVCNSSLGNDPLLVEPTQRAVTTWNDLVPETENCMNCTIPEQEGSGLTFHAESVILHELGHCALGLGHPNLRFDDPVDMSEDLILTSYANTYDGVDSGILVGTDGVRGSKDDDQRTVLGMPATNVTWFREDDNDPFVIDGTPIDIDSYSRSIPMLPTGSTWATAPNSCVSQHLGYGETKAVMMSPFGSLEVLFGLAADDVNMVKMGMSGEDRLAGTSDDYAVQIVWAPNCAGADVQVSFADLGGPDQEIAQCNTGLLPSLPPPHPPIILHYTVTDPLPPVPLELNQDLFWILDPPEAVIFANGFESGDVDAWTTAAGPVEAATVGGHPYTCPPVTAESGAPS